MARIVVPLYSKLSDAPKTGAKFYRKTAAVKAWRMKGPFKVKTSEGPLFCQDGYLCVDSRGYLYPVAADEFEQVYEEVEKRSS